MTVGYSAEHDELRQVVRGFLSERSPSREVRRLMEAGDSRDDEVWALIAGQLGLTGIAVPERYGGAGYGPVELGIVLEEMGRALLVAPYFATVVLAGQALAASGDEDAMARWLPGIAGGSLTATLAVAENSGSWDLDEVAATARPDGAAGPSAVPSSSSSTVTPPTSCWSSRERPTGSGSSALKGGPRAWSGQGWTPWT